MIHDLCCDPPHKFVGGKRDLPIKRPGLFPPRESIRVYHEPFCGGGGVFYTHYGGARAVLNDTNEALSKVRQQLRDRPAELIESLLSLIDSYNACASHSAEAAESFYLKQRTVFNNKTLGTEYKTAPLLFLLKACYNGLYRENREGVFNVAWGKRMRLNLEKFKLLAASFALQDAYILDQDFEDHLTGMFAPQVGDFVFLDPPYCPVSETSSFSSYKAGGSWGPNGKDRQRLIKILHMLQRRGIRFVCCDADTPETREIYSAFRLDPVGMKRMLNSKGDKRGAVPELLILPRTER